MLLSIAAFAFQAGGLCKPYPWNAWAKDRASVQAELNAMTGLHLVIVRYTPQHSPAMEWVYNNADLDHTKVVWARDMGEAQNRKLIEYYKDRKVWLLEPDATPPKPVPYPADSAAK